MEMDNIFASLGESVERLSAAASLLERTVAWLEQREPATAGAVEKMTAAVESHSELLQREQELLKKLEAAEQQILNCARKAAGRQQCGRRFLLLQPSCWRSRGFRPSNPCKQVHWMLRWLG
jgi:hypothetical protein